MESIAAPGLIAGAVGAAGNLLKASESLQAPAFRIHIALEKVAHQSIHGSVLLQGVVDGEGEVGRVIKLRGSRGARANNQQGNYPASSQQAVSGCARFTSATCLMP